MGDNLCKKLLDHYQTNDDGGCVELFGYIATGSSRSSSVRGTCWDAGIRHNTVPVSRAQALLSRNWGILRETPTGSNQSILSAEHKDSSEKQLLETCNKTSGLEMESPQKLTV
ncbi:hypothetical protein NC652_022918 [Populus alba x Populus x berolinensis]|nr:hypothetical protein NC652_022918 [Populus alba x Populus x berolinensis]